MTDRMDDKAASFEALSALADGESTERDVARACQAWRDSEGVRGRWQAYHAIGDALRSEGASASRTSDADFLDALRGRLAQEPVVLAPGAAAAARPVLDRPTSADGQSVAVVPQRRWSGPVSVAAGFVLVLGAVVNVMNGGVLSPANQLAQLRQAAQGGGTGQGAVAVAGHGTTPNVYTQTAWSAPDAALSQGLSNEVLRTGLAADNASGKSASAPPTFTQAARVKADGHSGYLIFVRDDQLDQLLEARREQAESRSLVSGSVAQQASDMIRTVSFDPTAP
jgi:sigma-E factor negative regulatory protein RseA